MNLISTIYSICIFICAFYNYATARTLNEKNGNIVSNQHVNHAHRHISRKEESISGSSATNNADIGYKMHECTFKQMKNLFWTDRNDKGFLCGPKSVVNGYSVTMLPKGMYFYHGSDNLPSGSIPGGQTKGM